VNLKNLNVVFAGCARDCATFLPSTLRNIRFYSSFFKESYTVIVENGSTDKTKKILEDNKKHNDFFLFCDNLNALSHRGQRLEKARNMIIDKIKDEAKLANCDILIILDLDDIGAYRVKENDLKNAVNYLFSEDKTAAVFAKQLGFDYDLWTLRDDKNFKNDFWVEVLQNIMICKNSSENITDQHLEDVKNNYIKKKLLSFNRSAEPIKVNSAFGGFGIYKMQYVLKNKRKYEGQQFARIVTKDQKKILIKYQKCEHVSFNQGLIDQNLNLYILPSLINGNFNNINFPPLAALNLILKE